MRKWLVTLAVAGASGIGAFLLTSKGRELVRRLRAELEAGPEPRPDWNERTQSELERIQATLHQIAQSLEPHGEMHR